MEAGYQDEPSKTVFSRWTSIVRNVHTLAEITTTLFELVKELPTQQERDSRIETITSLLDKRDTLIQELKPPYTEEEMGLGLEIVNMNLFIDQQLEALKQQIGKDIRDLKKKKQSQNKYLNPYQAVSTIDGTFYDKRK